MKRARPARRLRSPLAPSRRRLVPSLERWGVFRLDRAAAALRELSERALEREGVRLVEVAALSVLADRQELPQSALGERIGLDRSTTSELVQALEEDGFVARSPHPVDGRRHVVDITSSGLKVLESAHASLRRAERRFQGPLYDHEEEQLRDILGHLEPPEHALGDLYFLAPRRESRGSDAGGSDAGGSDAHGGPGTGAG